METKQITQAIIKVMEAVKGMEKNSQVGSGSYGYKGTNDADVKEVFNNALAENGLCIVPIDIEPRIQIDRWEEEYQGKTKSKQSIFTEVKTKYLLMHTSGESIELAGYGQGVDTQDKAAGKATTYALKNCLLYTFLTPVGKIDDTDSIHSQEMDTPPPKKKAPDQPKAPVALTDENIESSIQKGKQAELLDAIVAGKYTATETQLHKLQTANTIQ